MGLELTALFIWIQIGPSSGTDKVKKGGSYMCTQEFCYR